MNKEIEILGVWVTREEIDALPKQQRLPLSPARVRELGRNIIRRGASIKDLTMLTDKQQNVLTLIYPHQGKGSTLRQAGKMLRCSHETVRSIRDAALSRLAELQGKSNSGI